MRRAGLFVLVACCACSDFITLDDAGGDDATQPTSDVLVLPLDATIPGDGDVEADLFDASSESDAPLTCAQLPDGTPCKQAPDLCHTDGVCKAGACTAPGTHVDGYNWDPNDTTARCCGGTPVKTTSSANCGACGIKCNAQNGESCSALGGHYFCRGCIASSACWSHCCSESFSPPSCAASDCNGNCSSTYCPAGTHCVAGNGTSSDYCSY
jgi:hypothetical protein